MPDSNLVRYGRRLSAVAVLCACLVTQTPDPNRLQPVETSQATTSTAVEVPIVARRGVVIAEHEEPLPDGARVRFGSTRFRHPVEFRQPPPWRPIKRTPSPVLYAGRYLVTTGQSTFTLTDMTTGRRIQTQVPVFGGRSNHCSLDHRISPDGRTLLIYDAETSGTKYVGSIYRELPQGDLPLKPSHELWLPCEWDYVRIDDVFFTPDRSDLIVVGGGEITVFDTADFHIRRRIIQPNAVLAIAPSASRYLTSDRWDPRRRFDFVGGLRHFPEFRFKAPPRIEKQSDRTPPWPPVVIPDEIDTLNLVVRDFSAGTQVAVITIHHSQLWPTREFQLSPNGKYVSAEVFGTMAVWEVDHGREIEFVRRSGMKVPDRPNYITAVEFLDDGRTIRAETADHRKCFFDLTTGAEVPDPGPSADSRPEPFDHELGVLRRRGLPLPAGYAGVVMDVSRDGRFVALADRTGRVDIWEMDGRFVANLIPKGPMVLSVSFSPDGKRLAVSTKDRIVQLWPTDGRRELDRFEVPVDHDQLFPERVVFAPDGQRLLIQSGEIMAMWHIPTRSWLWDRPGQSLRHDGSRDRIGFCPDGRKIRFLESSENLKCIDAETGTDLTPLKFSNDDASSTKSVTAVAFSPDGTKLAVLFGDKDLQLRDISSGALHQRFHGITDEELPSGLLCFSRDGRRLASGDRRDHIRVWEVATGEPVFTSEYRHGAIHDAAFGPDGRTLITSNHREAIVWELKPTPTDGLPRGVEDLWLQLGGDAETAARAMWQLLDSPADTVSFLKSKVAPTATPHIDEIRRVVQALDAPQYRERVRAMTELRRIGRPALPILNEAQRNAAPELSRRARLLHAEISTSATAAERRHFRTLELLEWIGTPDSLNLARTWATWTKGVKSVDERK